MPACAVCSKLVRRARTGPTLCGARACRRGWLGADLRGGEKRERRRVHAEAVRIADSINDARTRSPAVDRAANANVRWLPLALLPSNDRVSARLPRTMRDRFLAKLAPKISASITRATTIVRTDTVAEPAARDALLGAACATCRGDCCTGGTDHAHLDEDSLARVASAHGWTTLEEVADAYEAYLPRVHYKHSCVYHAARGCVLPRDMRADICNRHLCGALAQLTRAIDAGAEAPFIAVSTSPTAPRRAAIIGSGERQDCKLPRRGDTGSAGSGSGPHDVRRHDGS